jgi:hypothetical protein
VKHIQQEQCLYRILPHCKGDNPADLFYRTDNSKNSFLPKIYAEKAAKAQLALDSWKLIINNVLIAKEK